MAKKKKSGNGGGKRRRRATVPIVPMVNLSEREYAHMIAVKEKAGEADDLYDQAAKKREEAAELRRQASEILTAANELQDAGDACDDAVRRMLREGPPQPTLFDKNNDAPAKPKPPETMRLWPENESEQPSTAAAAPQTVDWRTVSIDVLKKPGNATLTKGINALKKADVKTIGALEELRASSFNGAWHEKVDKLGREGADAVEDAVLDWLSKNRDTQHLAEAGLDRKEHRDGAANLASTLLPWREQVIAFIQREGEYGDKISGTQLRKFLRATSQDVDELDAHFVCDGIGVHVHRFQGNELDPQHCLITYVELAEEIRKLVAAGPAPEAEEAESPTSWQSIVAAKVIEKFEIKKPLSGPKLAELINSSGGSIPVGADGETISWISWMALVDGLQVTAHGEDYGLPYSRLAKIIREQLSVGKRNDGSQAA